MSDWREAMHAEDWPHQIRGVTETVAAIEAGESSICLTSPTGGGKSRMIVRLAQYGLATDRPVAIYTPRKLLTRQLVKDFAQWGLPFGVRAAGFEDLEDFAAPIQICSPATEASRVFRRKDRRLHFAGIMLWDEAHMQKAETSLAIRAEHRRLRPDVVDIGPTATPLGIGHIYQRLVVAGTNPELRTIGAHAPCYCYAPDEPDLKRIKRNPAGEFVIGQKRVKVWLQTIVARVIDQWRKLNPDARPTILFAPGVEESRWFVDQFAAIGVRAAHIDGDDVYLDGKSWSLKPEERDEIIDEVRDGRIKVICNRFVMREGVDIPELYHEIIATPIGSLLSCVQVYGRLLRAHASLDHVVLQDHGGNWHRHGSPNEDRSRLWREFFNLRATAATDYRFERMRQSKDPEPITCPECFAVRLRGPKCHDCGHVASRRVRKVVQEQGQLRDVTARVAPPRRVRRLQDTENKWRRVYHRCKRSGKTFAQARGLFERENGYSPPGDLPFMPTADVDWFRKVRDVPTDRLTGWAGVGQPELIGGQR